MQKVNLVLLKTKGKLYWLISAMAGLRSGLYGSKTIRCLSGIQDFCIRQLLKQLANVFSENQSFLRCFEEWVRCHRSGKKGLRRAVQYLTEKER